jgi:hypothetical protein
MDFLASGYHVPIIKVNIQALQLFSEVQDSLRASAPIKNNMLFSLH